jgi:hypothetical protein
VRGKTFGDYYVIDYRLRVHVAVTNKRCRAVLETVNWEIANKFGKLTAVRVGASIAKVGVSRVEIT